MRKVAISGSVVAGMLWVVCPSPHGGNTPSAVSENTAGVFQDMRYNGPDHHCNDFGLCRLIRG